MPAHIICPQCDGLDGHIVTPGVDPGLCTKCGRHMVATEDDPDFKPEIVEEPPPVDAEVGPIKAPKLPKAPVDKLEDMDVPGLRQLGKKLTVKEWWNKKRNELIKDIRKIQKK